MGAALPAVLSGRPPYWQTRADHAANEMDVTDWREARLGDPRPVRSSSRSRISDTTVCQPRRTEPTGFQGFWRPTA